MAVLLMVAPGLAGSGTLVEWKAGGLSQLTQFAVVPQEIALYGSSPGITVPRSWSVPACIAVP